jgi:plasmid maintenance system antidote protein VapI
MASLQEFRPNWASAPGDTITDILAERNISVREFALSIEQSTESVNELLQGRATITLGTARLLERVLGASVEFWMSRDFQYREDSARLHTSDRKWLAELPISDMIRFGWINPTPHPSEEIAACLSFFDVPDIAGWHRAYANIEKMAAFRTSPTFDSSPAAIAAWLRQGEIEGNTIQCGLWNPTRFENSLSKIRSLTRDKNPSSFIPELQNICAASGVAVAIVRAPSGCRASGATRFISADKALLQLSFRYLSDDQFWFTFFHEAGHLLLHDRRFFLEGLDMIKTKEEQEANDFAARTLIPPEFQYPMLGLPLNSHAIIKFAQKIGVAPGIVVGQLQHHKRLKHNQLQSLKRRFKWDE